MKVIEKYAEEFAIFALIVMPVIYGIFRALTI